MARILLRGRFYVKQTHLTRQTAHVDWISGVQAAGGFNGMCKTQRCAACDGFLPSGKSRVKRYSGVLFCRERAAIFAACVTDGETTAVYKKPSSKQGKKALCCIILRRFACLFYFLLLDFVKKQNIITIISYSRGINSYSCILICQIQNLTDAISRQIMINNSS